MSKGIVKGIFLKNNNKTGSELKKILPTASGQVEAFPFAKSLKNTIAIKATKSVLKHKISFFFMILLHCLKFFLVWQKSQLVIIQLVENVVYRLVASILKKEGFKFIFLSNKRISLHSLLFLTAHKTSLKVQLTCKP